MYTTAPAVFNPENVIVPLEVNPVSPVSVPVAAMFPLFAIEKICPPVPLTMSGVAPVFVALIVATGAKIELPAYTFPSAPT